MAEEAIVTAPAQSSRLCVKNIPKYVDEKRLREFFSAKGEVTDVKILRTKCGFQCQYELINPRALNHLSLSPTI